MENRNLQVLKNFVDYCKAHQEYTFWEALREWSKYKHIYGSMRSINTDGKKWVEDTVVMESDGSKITL